MARAHPTYTLRPMLPADVPLLAEVFRASITELTGDDYEPTQQDAWAAMANDEEAFGERLADNLTLVASVEGSPVGFVSLEGTENIDMLFVHPAVAGSGVGRMLCDAIETLAAARGAKRLVTDASETAVPFFEHRKYVGQRRNSVQCGGEWLTNTTMEKRLEPASPGKGTA